MKSVFIIIMMGTLNIYLTKMIIYQYLKDGGMGRMQVCGSCGGGGVVGKLREQLLHDLNSMSRNNIKNIF